LAIHDIMVYEPHPGRRGFFQRLYARVETSTMDEDWVWRLVDEVGNAMTDADKTFPTEDAALNDAVERLNGAAVVL
jgi:hypothetical protein